VLEQAFEIRFEQRTALLQLAHLRQALAGLREAGKYAERLDDELRIA